MDWNNWKKKGSKVAVVYNTEHVQYLCFYAATIFWNPPLPFWCIKVEGSWLFIAFVMVAWLLVWQFQVVPSSSII